MYNLDINSDSFCHCVDITSIFLRLSFTTESSVIFFLFLIRCFETCLAAFSGLDGRRGYIAVFQQCAASTSFAFSLYLSEVNIIIN